MTTFNYTVPPGAYLDEWLESEGMPQEELGLRLGVSRKFVNQLVNGHIKLTPELAQRLELVTGMTAHMWIEHESAYREELAALAAGEQHADLGQRISASLAKWLRDNGITESSRKDPSRMGYDLLRFHQFATSLVLDAWTSNLTQGEYALAARRSNQKTELDPLALGAWLRMGEVRVEPDGKPRHRFSDEVLRAALPGLRERCAHPDSDLLRDVQTILAEAGVAFLVVDPPMGLSLHGVTRWLQDGTPFIQQTGRMKSDGQIIPTLFHEIGHVLNDPRGELHMEFSTSRKRTSSAEKRANVFAREILFGEPGVTHFRDARSDRDISARAAEVGIAPGVAVVEMHRRRWLPHDHGNSLLVSLVVDANSIT